MSAENTLARLPKLAAIAVVLHEGDLLLVRRKNEPDAGLWGFPGGHVELGETAKDAAARELLEETSVIAKPRDYLTNLDIILHDGNGKVAFHYLLAAVTCTYTSGLPQGRDDVHEAAWIDFETVLSRALPMSKDVDVVLRRALEQQGEI